MRSAPRRRDALLLALAGVTAAAVGLVRPDGVGGALVVAVGVVVLVAHGRLVNRQAQVVAAVAVGAGGLLVLRTSPWVAPLVVLVAGGLVLVAASYARGGTLADVAPLDLALRGGRAMVAGVRSPLHTRDVVRVATPGGDGNRRRGVLALLRGLLLAAPIFALLVVLLAAGDAVFSSLLRLPVDLGELVVRLLLLVVGVLAAAVVLQEADEPPMVPDHHPWRPIGATEAVVVLASLVVAYGAFVATQVVTALGGADHVLQTAGLTRAEYARSGFFQLLGAVALTIGTLVAVRALARVERGPSRWVVRGLGLAAVALTLVVVGVAIVRLDLYEQAYGATVLRLASTAAAWWLGVAMVVVGVAFAGAWSSRRWLTAALAAVAVVAVVSWAVRDPEAVVAGRNVERAVAVHAGTVPAPPKGQPALDVPYNGSLGDDAVPTLVAGLDRLPPGEAESLRRHLCERRRAPRSWVEANVSASAAAQALAGRCDR